MKLVCVAADYGRRVELAPEGRKVGFLSASGFTCGTVQIAVILRGTKHKDNIVGIHLDDEVTLCLHMNW